jgi:hypothetical protein
MVRVFAQTRASLGKKKEGKKRREGNGPFYK